MYGQQSQQLPPKDLEVLVDTQSEANITGPEALYALYETLNASAQAQVISDLRTFEEKMIVVMVEENLTEDELDIELAFFSAFAQYFETGEQPEYLRSLITGS